MFQINANFDIKVQQNKKMFNYGQQYPDTTGGIQNWRRK